MEMERFMKYPGLAASVLVAGLTVGTHVQAAAVSAVSINEITNFSMSFVNGGGSFYGFTFSNSAAANELGGTGGVDLLDAPASCLNCTFNNEFSAHTSSAGFVYGDARIYNSDVMSGPGSASAIAEADISSGLAYASGSNVMNSFSGIQIIDDGLGPQTSLSFSFDANPFMSVDAGSGNYASMAMYVELKDYLGATVWSWAPDALNHTLLNGSYNLGNSSYADSTGPLAAGTYSLSIGMSQTIGLTAVPVPAAVWLFGSGLLGLIGVARRKR